MFVGEIFDFGLQYDILTLWVSSEMFILHIEWTNNIIKVCGPHLVTLLNWMPIILSGISARLVVKNELEYVLKIYTLF